MIFSKNTIKYSIITNIFETKYNDIFENVKLLLNF